MKRSDDLQRTTLWLSQRCFSQMQALGCKSQYRVSFHNVYGFTMADLETVLEMPPDLHNLFYSPRGDVIIRGPLRHGVTHWYTFQKYLERSSVLSRVLAGKATFLSTSSSTFRVLDFDTTILWLVLLDLECPLSFELLLHWTMHEVEFWDIPPLLESFKDLELLDRSDRLIAGRLITLLHAFCLSWDWGGTFEDYVSGIYAWDDDFWLGVILRAWATSVREATWIGGVNTRPCDPMMPVMEHWHQIVYMQRFRERVDLAEFAIISYIDSLHLQSIPAPRALLKARDEIGFAFGQSWNGPAAPSISYTDLPDLFEEASLELTRLDEASEVVQKLEALFDKVKTGLENQTEFKTYDGQEGDWHSYLNDCNWLKKDE